MLKHFTPYFSPMLPEILPTTEYGINPHMKLVINYIALFSSLCQQ